MADVECTAAPWGELSYELLCAVHDGAATVAAVAEQPAFMAQLGADLVDRLEVLMVAIRLEVRSRGIPPRYASSWAELDRGVQ